MKRKIVSFILVIVMMFSTVSLTSCSSKKATKDRWEISEADAENIALLDVTSSKTGNERVLDVRSSDCSFKEGISADDIRILGLVYNEIKTGDNEDEELESAETGSEEIQSEVDEKEVKTFTVTWNKSDNISVTFEDNDDNVSGYYVYLHKDGIEEDRYASGFVAVQKTLEEEKSYEVELADKLSSYEENPVIDIKHEDVVKIYHSITKDDIAVSGVFSGMTVEAVETDDNHTVVKLSGKPSSYGQGIIIFPADKTDCGKFTVKVDVVDTMLSVDSSSIKLADGKISFDVSDCNGKFTQSDDSKFTLNDEMLEIVKYSEDGTVVTLAIPSEAKDVDEAVDELRDKRVNANDKSMEDGIECEGVFFAPEVSIQAHVKNCELYSGYAEITLNLYASDGSFKELDGSDISFDDEFENSKVKSIDKISDDEYQLLLKVSTDNNVLKDHYITGNIAVKSKCVVNDWNTEVDDASCYVALEVNNGGDSSSLDFEDIISKAKTILSVAKFFGFPSGPLDELLDACGEYADKADSVSSFAKKCLMFAGIIDAEEDETPDIFKEVSDLKDSINKLDEHITAIENMIQQNDNDRRQSDDYKHYADYRAAWKAFYNGELKNMQDVMERFKTYYDEYIITFMKNSGKADKARGSINNGTLNIYLNNDGKVEVPSTESEAYSLYYSETELTKYLFEPEHFTEACIKYEKEGFDNAVELIMNDSTIDKSIDKFNMANNTKLTKDDIRTAIETQAASYAISKIGASDIIKIYNDYASAMTSNDIMYGNVMETYIKMLSYCYNFQSEAENDITSMQNYLKMFTIKSTAFASYVSWFSPSYKRKDNPIQKQYDNVMGILDREYLHDVSLVYDLHGDYYRIEGFYDWSYILNDKIHATCITYDWGNSTINFVPKTGSANEIVSQRDMQLIYNRYKDLYNRGNTTAKTFTEYLKNLNIIVPSAEKYDGAWVTLKYEYDDKIDENELYVASDVTGKYFTNGQLYKYGKRLGNDNKASKEYCLNFGSKYRVGYKLDDIMKTAERVPIYSGFRYRECHWYWNPYLTSDEYATLSKNYDTRSIIFTRGGVSEYSFFFDKVENHKTDYTWTPIEKP